MEYNNNQFEFDGGVRVRCSSVDRRAGIESLTMRAYMSMSDMYERCEKESL